MTLDMRSMVPPEVPAELDFGQAPMFEPLHRRLKAKETVVAGLADLGPLAGLLRWAQSRPLPGAGGGNRPGWMVGRSRWANPGPGGRREATPEAEAGAEAATWARAFLAGVEVHAPLLEEARRHAERPHSRMPFDYEAPFLADTTSEQVLLAFQRLAFSRAHALVLLGRGEEALGDLELGLRLVRHGHALPWLFQSGRRAMQVAHGMDAVWEGLSGRIWDEAGLVRLQQALEASRGSGEMSPGRTQLRTTALATVGFLEGLIPTDRGSASTGFRAGLPEQERSLFEWVRWFYPTGWSLQDQAAVVSGWILLDSGEAFDPREDAAFVRAMRATSDPVYQVFVLPKVRQMMTDAMVFPRFEADAVRLAASACAVERFRNREARLPESMEEVASMGLSRMEGTSGDADRLRYRKEPGGGYRVYSTGLDGRDDGGGLPTDPGPGGGAMAPEGLMDWPWVGVVRVTKPSTEGTIQ
jgi:hypothetical protein